MGYNATPAYTGMNQGLGNVTRVRVMYPAIFINNRNRFDLVVEVLTFKVKDGAALVAGKP